MNQRLNLWIYLFKQRKMKLLKTVCGVGLLSLFVSCGSPEESMNKTMADFIKKCNEENYDCECYGEKVRAHFKTDEAYSSYYDENTEVPNALIDAFGECSKDEFDF